MISAGPRLLRIESIALLIVNTKPSILCLSTFHQGSGSVDFLLLSCDTIGDLQQPPVTDVPFDGFQHQRDIRYYFAVAWFSKGYCLTYFRDVCNLVTISRKRHHRPSVNSILHSTAFALPFSPTIASPFGSRSLSSTWSNFAQKWTTGSFEAKWQYTCLLSSGFNN